MRPGMARRREIGLLLDRYTASGAHGAGCGDPENHAHIPESCKASPAMPRRPGDAEPMIALLLGD